jgi:type II secretion system protein C
MAKKQRSNKIVSKVPYWVEAFVVKLSLQHPDYGPRRLVPFLEQEGITLTTSAVYTILKRNNLQNKSLRLAKLEEQRTAEMVPEPDETTEPPAETPVSTVTPRIKAPSKPSVRRPWSLNPLNILLLGLVGYFWVSALGNLLEARREPTLPHDLVPMAVETIPQATVRPLEDYSIIYERNLFGASKGQVSVQEEVSVEDIPTAEKSLGLKLVGTVAGDDSVTSFAIIENNSTRKQELYHEGDKAGEVLIRRILRNRVVIDAGRGDEVLTLELQESGKKLGFSSVQQRVETSVQSNGRHQNLQLDREELVASLADIEELIQQVHLTPYTLGNQPMGFMITEIPTDSVLAKIGLRSGDVIKAINDKTVTGPDDAVAFFQKIRESREVEIQLTRRRRPIQISLNIK